MYRFGTENLLDDLLDFVNPGLNGKVIFIGDPAQLPPVGEARSLALDEDYFTQIGLTVEVGELNEVVRQHKENYILKNALYTRDKLFEEYRNELVFETKENEVHSLPPDKVTDLFCRKFPEPSMLDGSIIICSSNKQANNYNREIREKLYPGNPQVIAGDIVMIVQNNYMSYGEELLNGDMARVMEAFAELDPYIVPVVYTTKYEKRGEITFRKVVLKLQSGTEIACKMIDSLLTNTRPNLDADEVKALYKDFCIRNRHLKRGSDDFFRTLRSDPYFNAVRIKYGYAVTCHKAQGGEWPVTFVDYSDRLGLSDECLKWIYTATTRCSECLYGINLPNISPLNGLSFTPVIKIRNFPSGALAFGDIPGTPFHSPDSLVCKLAMYHQVVEKLENTDYVIEFVKPDPFREEYNFRVGGKLVRFDVTHDKAGFFSPFRLMGSDTSKEVEALAELLNKEVRFDFEVNYIPEDDTLIRLHHKVLAACNDLDIPITNIRESPREYFVTYYLKTSGIMSYIEFYYKNEHQLSRAIPKSDLGDEDSQLLRLIELLDKK